MTLEKFIKRQVTDKGVYINILNGKSECIAGSESASLFPIHCFGYGDWVVEDWYLDNDCLDIWIKKEV